MANESWNDERIKWLTMLWRDHGWAAGEIATVLGCSRSAVLGKVARLKLTRNLATGAARPGRVCRGAPARESSPTKPVAVRAVPIAVLGPAPVIPAGEPPPVQNQRYSLVDLGPEQCRWVLGRPFDPPVLFCGDPAIPGKPYCPWHCQIAYVPLLRASRRRGGFSRASRSSLCQTSLKVIQ
jgi:GcrA cell cycle regulator